MKWDVKAMLKLIVTSATYRQSSNFTPALLARDPENRLLARGPRFRLPAEVLRDQALALGGLLVERIGGPSVKPYQPPGLWEAVSYNGDATYEADHGESLYRRGLYTFWKRQSPPPGMLTFDGPTREVCTVRRPRTNTPLQALVLLNDVTYVEAARGLATRMMREGKERHRVRFPPGDRSFAEERGSRRAARATSTSSSPSSAPNPNRRALLLKSGESPADPALDACELAAWTMTASVLLNLDEVDHAALKGTTAMQTHHEHVLALTRREFFGRAATGIGALALASLLNGRRWPLRRTGVPGVLAQPHFAPRAKRIIYLFMQGGPSQMDLFDPKPGLAKRHGEDLPESVRRGSGSPA